MNNLLSQSPGPRLFGPESQADPYPTYHRLRALAPVLWSEEYKGWLVTGYHALSAIARHPAVSIRAKSELNAQRIDDFRTRLLLFPLSQTMLTTDAPAHGRLRSLVTSAFTSAAVESMRPRIQHLVDAIFDQAQAAGHMDIISDLAVPLPIQVIVELLGIPLEGSDRLGEWSNTISVMNDWVGEISPQQAEAVGRALTEFNAYLRPLIEERRLRPQADLMSALITAREATDRLSETELYSQILLLLATGQETTANLIGNGMLSLLRHPGQYQKLCNNPDLVRNAVEELLRFDGPTQASVRKATEDFEVAGVTIRRGQLIFLIWGAANRDPAQFPDPDHLDLTRTDIRHLAFGAGAHYCLGAPLARLEAEVVFSTISRRFPQLRLATHHLQYRSNLNLRRLTSLPVFTS